MFHHDDLMEMIPQQPVPPKNLPKSLMVPFYRSRYLLSPEKSGKKREIDSSGKPFSFDINSNRRFCTQL